jgi:hypothetical protein
LRSQETVSVNMSSSAGPSSARPQERQGKEKHRIEKVLYRVKTVFRKGSSSKGAQAAGPVVPTVTPAPAPAPVPAPAPPTESQPAPEEKKQPEYENATRIPRSQIHEERAKKLGARFGLEIKPGEWHSTEGDVMRVEKAARMRIHRVCHRCQATFGSSNECPSCTHVRCKKCNRYPPERTESERKANKEKREALERRNLEMAPIVPSYDYSEKIVLKRPSKTGGQDLVYKKVRQRVRRHCHVCNSLMSGQTREARTCGSCGHKRCNDCARAP